MSRARRLLPAAAVLAGLLPAAPARADIGCTFNAGAKSLTIIAADVNDTTVVTRQEGGNQVMVLDKNMAAVACANGSPTVTTLDSISYQDLSAGKTRLLVFYGQGALAPGATSEGQFNASEIEISAAMGSGDDELWVGGAPGADRFRLGSPAAGQVALNTSAAEIAADADITATSAEIVYVNSIEGADTIGAQGGLGTGAELAASIAILAGGEGDDTIAGAGSGEVIGAGPGNDTVTGGGGDDRIDGGLGDDTVDGGPGTDAAIFGDADVAVSVDLALQGAAQATGAGSDLLTGFESLEGGDEADVLRGDGGPNVLKGGKGDDVMAGRAGDDLLDGQAGFDTLDYTGAPAGVTVDLAVNAAQPTGGDGSDEVKAENIAGSPFADVLAGDGAQNRLEGGGGADQLSGRGADDVLLVRDGEADTADCGDGADRAEADVAGTDVLTGCEVEDLATVPVTPAEPGAPEPGGGTSVSPGTPGATAACLAPRRVRVKLDRRLRRATVRMAGRRLKTRRVAGRLTVRVDLRGRAPGVYRLRIAGRTAKGARLTQTRRLRVCAQ